MNFFDSASNRLRKKGSRVLPGGGGLRSSARPRSRRCRPRLDVLEDRTLLAVTATVSSNGLNVTFYSPITTDNVYLQTSGSEVQWSTDGSDWTTLNGFILAGPGSANQFTFQLSGDVHVDDFTGAGGDLTFGGTGNAAAGFIGPSDFYIDDSLYTQGGNLTINDVQGVDLAASMVVSTQISANSDAGNAGDLSIQVTNPDVLNPILNIGFDYPHITLNSGAAIVAQASSSFKPGDVTLSATNTNYTLDGLSFPTIAGVVRSSAVTLDDGASVLGGNVSITATSGDVPVVSTFISHQGENSNDEFASWGQWVGGFLNGALQVAGELPYLNLATLPVSINYRDASASVTVGNSAEIEGNGTVNIQSNATSDAEGQAIYSRNTSVGVAIAFMYAGTDAETDIMPNAVIDSTGGDVDVGSTSNATATATARVSQNLTSSTTNANNKQVSLTLGIVNQIANSTIAAGATVRAAGGVSFQSTGSASDTGQPSTTSYTDGTAGIAAAINVDKNKILANADGTIISGIAGASPGTPAAALPTLTLNPFTDVDFANNGIDVSSDYLSQVQTGQAIVYNSDGNGAIPGLISGATYYVIVPSSPANEIQLADTVNDAMAGDNIDFSQYPTLAGLVSGQTVTVPITDIDEPTSTIDWDFNPGFTNGEALTYTPVQNQYIGGLASSGQTTYFAIFNPASPNTLQLAATQGAATASPASFISLNLDPQFTGFRQSIPVTLNPSGFAAGSIEFNFNAGFQPNTDFVYQGSGISELTDGTTYWVIPDASNPKVIQLAGSMGGAPITFAESGPKTLTFDPSVSIDGTNNTVDLGFNFALEPLSDGNPGYLANGTPLVYEGALDFNVQGLTSGTTYYVIQDPGNPQIFRLTQLTTDPLNNVTYAQEAYTAGVTALSSNASAAESAFQVSVNSSTNPANTLDFGSQATFNNNDIFIYEGTTSPNPAINGLTPGKTYFALVPDSSNPGVIELIDSTGAVQQISLPSGDTSTTVNFISAQVASGLTGGAIAGTLVGAAPDIGSFPVSVDLTADGPNTIDFGSTSGAGFDPDEPLVYDGPTGTNPGITGLTVGDIYYVALPDPLNPSIIELTDSSGNVQTISLPSGATTTTVNFGAFVTVPMNNANVTVASDAGTLTLTFNNPGNPGTPFDPGLSAGDPFIYEGPETTSDSGIAALTIGTTYYVVLTTTPGVIELDYSNGSPVTLATGTSPETTNLNYLTSDNVTVDPSANTLTFNTPGEPGTPFDPGYNAGDPFVYEGPVAGNPGITGLTVGQTYNVVLTGTPGVIQLDTLSGTLVSLDAGMTGAQSTNITYTTPFTPTDNRSAVVTSIGNITTSFMTGASQTLAPLSAPGIYINAGLTDYELAFAGTTIGGSPPSWTSKNAPAEGSVGPTLSTWFSTISDWSNPANPPSPPPPPPPSGQGTSGSPTSPASTGSSANSIVQSVPGGTGNSPTWSFVGTFAVLVDLNTVHADVAGSAVLEAASNISVSSSFSLTYDTGVNASATREASQGKATEAALAVIFAFSDPTVLATIDDGAHVDAAGALAVTASTSYPLEVPTSASDAQGDVVYSSSNSSYNPLNFLTQFLTDGMLGLQTDILNDSAAAKASAAAEGSTSLAGTIQIFVYLDDTEATIGDAMINQKEQDTSAYPNAAGVEQTIKFQNPDQSISVESSMLYMNASETGTPDLNIAPTNFVKLARGSSDASPVFDLYGDTKSGPGGKAIGASIAVFVESNKTIAEISSGAMIGVGSSGTLDVGATQQIVAVSLVQSGGAGGDVGFTGTLNWFNLTSLTEARIDDGVTVNAGFGGGPGGAVSVHADDNMIVVAVTGAAVTSNHIGVGFTVAVNNVERTTLALIGELNPSLYNPTPYSSPYTPAADNFDVSSLSANATNEGAIGSLAYAAATVSSPKPAPPTGGSGSSSSSSSSTSSSVLSNLLPGYSVIADVQSLKSSASPSSSSSGSSSSQSNPTQAQKGYAISGDASGNVLQHDTEAYINAPGTFDVGAGTPLNIQSVSPSTVIRFANSENLVTGDIVTYSTTGNVVGGLTNNIAYYVIVLDPYDIELASSYDNAMNGVPITLNPSGASGTQSLTTGSTTLTFDPTSDIVSTLLNFNLGQGQSLGLATGEPVEYQTSGNAIGGLTKKTTYYAIVETTGQIELADSYADAVAGNALTLSTANGVSAQVLVPVTFAVNAADQTVVVSIAGAFAASITTGSSNTGVAGSFSTDDLIATTKAYIADPVTTTPLNITTGLLDVTATHGGYIGSLTAGAGGASGVMGTAVAGSVSVDLVLPDTEAYISGATINLSGDSNITATESAVIAAVAGSAALGGKGGYGVSLAVNLIGFSNQIPVTPNEPAATLAYIENSTITDTSGTLSVLATSANAPNQPSIIAIVGALGAGTQANSTGVGGMISVNIIKDETEAYITGSTVTVPSGQSSSAPALNVNVVAHDDSEIVALGGAVGFGMKNGVGAAIGYNEIQSTIMADLDDSILNVTGSVTVTASSNQTIGGVVLGVGVSAGNGLGADGSVLINIITNTVDAHVNDGSNVTASGPVALSATDQSLIVAIAGGVAVSLGGTAAGASISYNRISNDITSYINDSKVNSNSSVSLTATSSPLLVAVGAQGSGGKGFSGAGTLTINSIANTVDADITSSTVTATAGDVAVNASESASEYVVALGVAGSATSSAIGASIAYNYLGGLSPLDPNVISYDNGIVAGSIAASVTADAPISPDSEIYLPNHGLSTGEAVVYNSGGGSPIGGLVDGQTYYVIVLDANHVELASTSADATAGNAIALSSTGSTISNQSFTLSKLQSNPAVTFNPTSSSISGEEIYLFTVTQSNGTLQMNFNGTLPTGAPSIQVTGSALTALFGSSPNATSNSVAGSGNAADVTTINSSNDGLTVTVNGTQLPTITLAPGDYTPAALAAELQKELNGAIFAQDGLHNGEELVYDNAGGASIEGLTEGASYYIIKAPDNGIELAASQADALSSPTNPISLGPNVGSGTGHNFTPLVSSPAVTFGPSALSAVITSGNELTFASDPGLYTGEPVTYHANGGTPIGNLTDDSTYYVISVNSTTIQLDPSLTDAESSSPTQIIGLTSSTGTGTFTVPVPTSGVAAYIDSSTVTAGGRVLVLSGFNNPSTLPGATSLTINPSSDVTVSGDAIHFATPDGLTTGQEVVYHGGGTSIGGLTDGHSYYVIVLDPYTIKLAATYADAVDGTAVQANVAGVNTSTNQITLSQSNLGLYTGEAVVYNVGTGSDIGGLANGTTYYVIAVDASHIMLASSVDNANNGTAISLTSSGSGTLTLPTTSTSIALSSSGTSSSQTITPLDISAGASFNASSTSVTLPGNTTPAATVAVTQNLGTLTINANDSNFMITGGDAESSLLGSPATTSGDTITGSAVANLTITAGSNDSLDLMVNGHSFTVTLAAGTYTADSLALQVQTTINNAINNNVLPVTNAITFATIHGLTTGQEVVYHNGGGTSIGNLTDGNTYFVFKVNDYTIQLASSHANALAGTVLALSSVGSGNGQSFTPTVPTSALAFGPSAVTPTNASADEISFASSPSLATGDAVFYNNGGGTSIGGLTSGQTYYAIVVDATHIKLASTFNNAIYDQPVFLTSPGTGSNQSLVVKPTGFDLAGVTVPLPIPIGGQIVSVTAAGAGGTNSSGAGAVNLNFVRMNIDAHITNNSNVQATGDIDVEATDTSKIGSGTGSIAISVGGGTAVNASVGLNDIANTVSAYVQGSTARSSAGAVNVTATETAQDVNIVIGGAGSGGGNAFGGSFAINFISNTVDAYIAASNGVGMGGTPSVVTAFGALSVTATDTASIATLAGNVGVSLGGTAAGAAAVAVNDISDTDTATIDDSTASSGGAMMVSATFAQPTQLPAGLDVQIAAMAVSGAGAGQGAFAGSLSLNWINNTVQAEISNIAAPQFILAGGKLSVIADDDSTIDSLAGAIAIAGVGASAASVAVGASISFNYLGGDPRNPSTTNNNVVRAAIDNVTGSLKAAQIDVSTTYTGEINNITVAGSAAVGAGAVQVAVGGAVSINIIRNTTDAHISGSPNISTTGTGADSTDVTAMDTSTIQALAGGVGITAGTGTASLAAGVSVAVNQIYNTDEAYVENSVLKSGGDVNVTTTSTPTIKALTIGVAVAVGAGSGGFAGSGAGAGSGDTVGDNVYAYIDTSTVSANGTITLTATDSSTIQTIAGALGVGVSVGASGVGASVGISVAVNNEMDKVKAYINNSTVTASGGDVSLTAMETSIVDAWTIGGAVGGAGGGGVGVGVGAAGAGSGNFVGNTVVASITGNSTVTTKTSGDVTMTASDTSSIEAIAGGLGIGVGIGGAGGAGISLGVAAANNNIDDTVQAFVNGSTVTSVGKVQIAATENATIKTVTVGGAVAVGAGVEVGVGVAVAGSDSSNTIENNVDAYISGGSTVTAQGGSLSIKATDTSIITAGGGGLGVGVGVGPGLFGAGLAAAAGFAVATNDVNNSVLAYVDNSTAKATGNSVTIAATETATMTAVTVGEAVAVGVAGVGFAGAAAVGVGSSTNTTSNTVEAYLAHGASVTTTTSGDVTLTATDSPNLTAKTVAASVSFAVGLVAGSFGISAAIANNNVGDTVEAYSNNSTINSAGQVMLTATMPTTAMIQATSVAASVAISGAPAGAAFAGAGANSTNTVNNTITSYIDGTSPSSVSTVTAAGNITLSAQENAPITSEVGAGAGAGALIGGSIGVSLATNTVSSNVSAYADNASVTSTGGQISIGASSTDSVNTLSVATAIAAASAPAAPAATRPPPSARACRPMRRAVRP